jgi:uncharacterized membrane protein YfhO
LELTATKSGNGYVYFKAGDSDDVEYINITLPNGDTVTQYIDYKPYIYDLGYLKKGEKVSIYAPVSAENDGYFYLFSASLNDTQFISGYNTLKEDSLNVTSFKDTEIDGTINASADGILYTSINYDTGWSVYIDGEKVSKSSIHAMGQGALLGVDITAGEHTIKLKYTPEGLILGILISAVALAMMILLCAIIKTGIFNFQPELYVEPVDETEENSSENATEPESVDGIPLEELPEKDLNNVIDEEAKNSDLTEE